LKGAGSQFKKFKHAGRIGADDPCLHTPRCQHDLRVWQWSSIAIHNAPANTAGRSCRPILRTSQRIERQRGDRTEQLVARQARWHDEINCGSILRGLKRHTFRFSLADTRVVRLLDVGTDCIPAEAANPPWSAGRDRHDETARGKNGQSILAAIIGFGGGDCRELRWRA